MQNFDFRIRGEVVGSFEQSEEPGWIRQNATFTVDGRQQVNTFAVRLEKDRPVAVQLPDGEWLDVPADVYPSAAWPLVLRLGLHEFDRLDEGSGTVSRCQIRVEDGLFVEYVNGKADRRFRVEDGRVTWISWGDETESHLLDQRPK